MAPIPSLVVSGTGEPDDREVNPTGLAPTDESHGAWAVLRAHRYLLSSSAYLLISLFIWSHVWIGHPTSTTTCGCGDSSPSIWYISWAAFAISHGQNPLFSTAIGYPTGVNLIFTAYGIILAPVTWLFGPVAALNVGLTASPVLSALAMFAMMSRWVSWTPAAFVAGLFYGFSPLVLNNLSVGHADFGMVAIPPLIVIGFEELFIRQRHRPVVTGIVLGLLVSLQFFIGTEVLILTMIEMVIGIVMVVVYAAKRHRIVLRQHAKRAVVGCFVAAATAFVLLAYPVWLALAGPAHFAKSVHPGLQLTKFEAWARYFFLPAQMNGQWQHIVGGYQGPVLTSLYSAQYFGFGVAVVSLGGLIFWRRDRLLLLFALLTLVTLVLATSSGPLLAMLPFLNNIEPLHFVLFADLTAAVVLGLVVDHSRAAVRQTEAVGSRPIANAFWWPKPLQRRTGAIIGLAVAALAIVQPAAYLARSIPMTVQRIVLPTWFRTVAPKLSGHPVVLALPAPFTTTEVGLTWQAENGESFPFAAGWKQAALTWQALSGQRYSIVGAGGLGAGISHLASENQGQNVITEVTFAYGSRPKITSSGIAAVNRALSEWGVTTVVLPDQPELPTYDQVASVTDMAALITAATGTRPVHLADAWVWRRVDHDVPSVFPDAAQYERCTGGSPGRGVVAVDRTTACVLGT